MKHYLDSLVIYILPICSIILSPYVHIYMLYFSETFKNELEIVPPLSLKTFIVCFLRKDSLL